MTTGRNLLTISQAAKYLGVAEETIKRRRRANRASLPAKRDMLAIGAPLLFSTEDLDKFRASFIVDDV